MDALRGLEAFSQVEVVYVFDRVDPQKVQTSARHPRSNDAWPEVGIFAQRAKGRPNRLGVSVCRLLGLDGLDGPILKVQAFDAIDGTPVLDVKPYMVEFAPRGEVPSPTGPASSWPATGTARRQPDAAAPACAWSAGRGSWLFPRYLLCGS